MADIIAEPPGRTDRCLTVLRTGLSDVRGVALTAPQLAVDGLARFVDVWFDNLAVRDRIKQSRAERIDGLAVRHWGAVQRRRDCREPGRDGGAAEVLRA